MCPPLLNGRLAIRLCRGHMEITQVGHSQRSRIGQCRTNASKHPLNMHARLDELTRACTQTRDVTCLLHAPANKEQVSISAGSANGTRDARQARLALRCVVLWLGRALAARSPPFRLLAGRGTSCRCLCRCGRVRCSLGICRRLGGLSSLLRLLLPPRGSQIIQAPCPACHRQVNTTDT